MSFENPVTLTRRVRYRRPGERIKVGGRLRAGRFLALVFSHRIELVDLMSGRVEGVAGPFDEGVGGVVLRDEGTALITFQESEGIFEIDFAGGATSKVIGGEAERVEAVRNGLTYTGGPGRLIQVYEGNSYDRVWSFAPGGSHQGDGNLMIVDVDDEWVLAVDPGGIEDNQTGYVLRQEDGESVWDFNMREWLSRYESAYLDWLEQQPSLRRFIDFSYAWRRRSVEDGAWLLALPGGLVVCLDKRTGEPRWRYHLERAGDRSRAKGIAHVEARDGYLYFFDANEDESFDSPYRFVSWSGLRCMEAKTGRLVFEEPGPFTPAGVTVSFMVGSYLFAGNGEYMAAYDVEKREYVWQYRSKGRPIFSPALWVIDDGFVVEEGGSREDECILWWFQNQAEG